MSISGSGGGSSGGGGGIKAGAAYVELSARDKGLTAGLDRARAKLAGFGSSLIKVGTVVSGLGAGVFGGSLWAMLGRLDELGKLDGVAKVFGLTAEAATGLFGVFRAAGSDLRDATEGIVTFNQRITDAIAGAPEATKFFNDLGVSAQEFVGLAEDEKFFKFHAALRNIGDESKRAGLLLKGVGEDTGKNLLPTLNQSNEQLREQAKGFALSSAEMQAAARSSAAVNAATAKLDKVWSKLVIAIAPVVEMLANKVGPVFDTVSTIVTANSEAIGEVATVVAGVGVALLGAGAGIAAFGAVFSGLAAILAAVKIAFVGVVAVAGFLLSPIGLVTAAAVGLGIAFTQFTETGRGVLDGISGGFRGLADTATRSWGGIVAAVGKGDLRLAGQIALAGLTLEWTKALAWLTRGWVGFKGIFVDGWADVIAGLKLMFWDFTAWIARTFSFAIKGVVKAAIAVTEAVGLDDFAANLRTLDFSDENINRNRDRIKNDILRDRGARQAENDAFRGRQLADADQAVADARKRLGELIDKANAPKEFDPVRESPGRVAQTNLVKIAAARGQFGGAGAAQAFGTGTDIPKKQLDANLKGNEIAGKMLVAIQDIRLPRIS